MTLPLSLPKRRSIRGMQCFKKCSIKCLKRNDGQEDWNHRSVLKIMNTPMLCYRDTETQLAVATLLISPQEGSFVVSMSFYKTSPTWNV